MRNTANVVPAVFWKCAPLALAALVALSGCTRTYSVKVDAIHNPQVVGGHSFKIVGKQAGMDETDPAFRQASRLVKTALSGHGMYEAPEPDEAEVVVEIDYGIGPRRLKIEREPTSLEMRDPLARIGLADYQRNPMGRPRMTTMDGREIQEILPSESEERIVSEYDKHLSISAREAVPASEQGDKRARELWRVEVSIRDEDSELSELLPVLAGAASDYIGAKTDARETIRVAEKGDSVTFVQGGN